MTAPQLEYYAADRAGHTAIIHTESGSIVAWVERDGDGLRGRGRGWRTAVVETVPQVIREVAGRATSTTTGTISQRVDLPR